MKQGPKRVIQNIPRGWLCKRHRGWDRKSVGSRKVSREEVPINYLMNLSACKIMEVFPSLFLLPSLTSSFTSSFSLYLFIFKLIYIYLIHMCINILIHLYVQQNKANEKIYVITNFRTNKKYIKIGKVSDEIRLRKNIVSKC